MSYSIRRHDPFRIGSLKKAGGFETRWTYMSPYWTFGHADRRQYVECTVGHITYLDRKTKSGYEKRQKTDIIEQVRSGPGQITSVKYELTGGHCVPCDVLLGKKGYIRKGYPLYLIFLPQRDCDESSFA